MRAVVKGIFWVYYLKAFNVNFEDRYHEIDGKRCEAKEGVPKQEMNQQNNYVNYGYNNYGGGYGGYGYSGAFNNQNYAGFNGPPVAQGNFGNFPGQLKYTLIIHFMISGGQPRWNGGNNFANNGWNQGSKGNIQTGLFQIQGLFRLAWSRRTRYVWK